MSVSGSVGESFLYIILFAVALKMQETKKNVVPYVP